MPIRRFVFYAQFGAIIVLPLWLLVGRGIIFGESGWDFVGFLLLGPILALAMAIIMGLTYARKSVRQARAVSWPDVALHIAWYASLIVVGFVDHPAAAVIAVVLTVGAFWFQLWQLISEIGKRVNRALEQFGGARTVNDGDYRVIRVESRPSDD